MKLLRIIRSESFVRFRREIHGHDERFNDSANPGTTKTVSGVEQHDITTHEAPLKSFDDAMQAMSDAVCNILEVGQEYKKGMIITSMSISHTKHGTRSVAIAFKKALTATETNHSMVTPMFQIDNVLDGEEGRMQCTKLHAEQIAEFIEEAIRYAEGDRAQQMLPLDDGESEQAEPTEGDVLDFRDHEAPAEKPKPAAKKVVNPTKKKPAKVAS